MKKIICLLMATLLVGLTFAGCSSKEEGLTIKEGTLTVGMEVGYPPMEYLDEDGVTKIGFDVEMAQKMADLMGLKLEIVNTAWDGIFAALEKGEFDMIMSAVSITPERQAKYILTKPYISNKIVLAVKNENTDITKLEDLAGKKVAVQTDTTSDYFAKKVIDDGTANFEILRYEKITQCYDELKLNRVDAILVDEVVAVGYRDESKIVWRNTEGEPMGICLQKDSTELAELVEKAVDTLYYDGTVATIATKYFGSNVTEGVRVVTEKPVLEMP